MLIYFDLNRGRLVSSPGSGDSLAGIEFKRGDTLPVTVRFTRSLEIVELPTGATGIIAIKPVGSYDVEPLASAVSWVKTGTAETSSYDFTLNLSTTGLNTALGVGTPADFPWIAVNFELQFTVSGNVTSSQTVPAIVHNDVIRDTDLTPTPLPDLTSWLDAQLTARDYIPSTEKGTTEGKIPVLGADGKLDPARLPSVALTTTSTVANAAARLALSTAAAAGKIIVEADTGKSYGLIANGTPANSADWIQLGDRDIAIADVIGLPAALAEKETPAAAQTKADTAQAAAIAAAAIDATNKANAAQAAGISAASTDATNKANAAQAAAIAAAAIDATNKAATKANLSGGNIFSGLQQNSGIVTSSAALGTAPTQLPTQAQVRDMTTLNVLAIGQSNMQRGVFANNTGLLADTDIGFDRRIKILNNAGVYVDYDLQVPGLSSELGTPSTSATNGSTIPFHFAKYVAEKTGSTVRVSASALGGQSLDYWGINVAGTTHNPSAAGWVKILTALASVPKIDCVIICQGETLNGRTAAQQKAGYALLFNTLVATGKVTADTPYILCEVGGAPNQVADQAIALLDADPAFPNVRVVKKSGGAMLNDGSGVHFTHNEIRDLGNEAGRQLLKDRVNIREIVGGDTHLARFRTAYASGNQVRYRIPLSTYSTGITPRVVIKCLLSQGLTFARPECSFDVIVQLSGNNQAWSARVASPSQNSQLGAFVELVNVTATTADLLIHFVNPFGGNAFWTSSFLKVAEFLPSEYGEQSVELTIGTITEEIESSASYLAGGNAINSLIPNRGALAVSPLLEQSYGTNYRRYRLAVNIGGNLTGYIHIRGVIQMITVGASPRAVCFEATFSKWTDVATPSIMVNGRKTNLGVKLELENITSTSFDVLVRVVYPSSSANTSFLSRAAFTLFSDGSNLDLIFGRFLNNQSTITSTQESETNPLYQPGGAGVSDF